ncbi:MAG: hypothetical protein ACO259_07705 [Bacteroidia bacterium]
MREVVNQYIQGWRKKGYTNDIPDEVPKRIDVLNKAPSYKRIAISILKNDIIDLGYTPQKTMYYDLIKYNELMNRAIKNKQTFQLRLW